MSKTPSRLSLAMEFACAAMTVLVSGYVADETLRTANKKRHNYKPKPTCFDFGPLQCIDRREFRNGGKYYGLFTQIAKDLSVNPSTVEMVSRGARISERILNAIVAGVRRIDSDPQLSPQPLSPFERAQFARGGSYYGVSTRVAKSLGMLNSNMHRALRGKTRSPRILASVRAEMARVDAELAAKNGGGK